MKLRQFLNGQRKRKSLNQTQRCNMYKQAHGRCWYCGAEVSKSDFIIEHVEPLSRGGVNSQRNLVVSCRGCDREKGNLTLAEFRAKRGVQQFHGEPRRPMPGPDLSSNARLVNLGEALARAGVQTESV